MPYNHEEVEHIKKRIQELFRISSELERSFPGRKFTLDGHLIGSIGEVIASYHYGLELMPTSTEQHDATAPDGRMVQIKVTQGWHHIALRSEPEHLIVFGSMTIRVRHRRYSTALVLLYGKLAGNNRRSERGLLPCRSLKS